MSKFKIGDDKTELGLTKLQIQSLQEWKKAANYLLVNALLFVENDISLLKEIEYFLTNGKLENK